MSFQAMAQDKTHRVLDWCFNQTTGSTYAKLILITLESAAKKIIYIQSMDDLCKKCLSSQRTFKKYISELEEKGFISIKSYDDEYVNITFGPYKITIKNYRSMRMDNAWSKVRAKTFALKGYHCFYCGKEAGQVDHIVPRCQGGTNNIENLVPCCSRCNQSKGGRTLEEWLQ